MEALKKMHFKKYQEVLEREVKIDKWPDLSYLFSPIDCCVIINHEPDGLFIGDIQSDILIVICISLETFVFLGCLLIHLNIKYNTDIKVQHFFVNRASTMLNIVFKPLHVWIY